MYVGVDMKRWLTLSGFFGGVDFAPDGNNISERLNGDLAWGFT